MSSSATRSSPPGLGGRILFIDLSTAETWTEPTRPYADRFLGARGINQWFVAQLDRGTGPLGPGNVLAMGSGALVGTLVPSAGRLTMSALSPLTEAAGYSNAGGKFACSLKFAGYDHLVVSGEADQPVYLHITSDTAELRPARHIWGLTTTETTTRLRMETGSNADVLSIGPAGENLVRFASIIVNSGRAAGRSGFGAVMGAKRLKAVVAEGDGAVVPADPENLFLLARKMWDEVCASQVTKARQEDGCHRFRYNEYYLGQARNYQGQPEADGMRNLEPEVFQRWQRGRLACHTCPTYCSAWLEVDTGEHAGLQTEGIEASDVPDFGPRLGCYDPAFVVKAHALVNEVGMDMDSVSVVMAWAMECFERDVFTKRDTGGLDISWGNCRAIEQLLRNIAYRRGLGDRLAEGVMRAAAATGRNSERWAFHVRGQEMPEDAARVGKGWGLAAAVDTRGGGHMSGAPTAEFAMWPESVCRKTIGVSSAGDINAYEGKAKVVAYYERLKAVVDSLGICYFNTEWSDWKLPGIDKLAEILATVTGRQYSAAQLLAFGERIVNVEKFLNTLHKGHVRRAEHLPWRFFEEPIESGAFAGSTLDHDRWQRMLSEYYTIHGWDPDTGWQPTETLIAQDLPELADRLAGTGLVP